MEVFDGVVEIFELETEEELQHIGRQIAEDICDTHEVFCCSECYG